MKLKVILSKYTCIAYSVQMFNLCGFKSITNDEEEDDNQQQDAQMAESANDDFNFERYDEEDGELNSLNKFFFPQSTFFSQTQTRMLWELDP